jgi:hypothetical protein
MALVSACAAPSRRECALEPATPIVHSDGLGFDGIAVAQPRSGAAVYLWSEQSGLWAKRGPRGRPVRLADRCRGGIDATPAQPSAARAGASADAGLFVACSRATEDDADESSEVVVYELDQALHTTLFGSVGRAGRDGHGVALALQGDKLYVAFHDGSIGQHTVSLATLPVRAERPTRDGDEGLAVTRVSRTGQAANEPSLFAHAGHLYVAFSELALNAEGKAESAVMLSRDGAPAQQLTHVRAASPTPKLTSDARGLVLSYRDRDRTRNGDRSELYVLRLDAAGRPAGKAQAIGRANTEGEPSVYGCGALTTALLPREYGGERFVGINALDGELASIGAGHQFYATGRDFVLASGACVEGAWLLMAADRAAPSKPGVDAVALRFSCRE